MQPVKRKNLFTAVNLKANLAKFRKVEPVFRYKNAEKLSFWPTG